MHTKILLKKRRFKCYQCSKMAVAETSLVKKNHQIPRIIHQKIAQKLIEKTSMTDIPHQLSISTSTVIRKLNYFHFEHDFSRLPEVMSWDVETIREVTVSIGRCRWVSLRKILTISISSLFLREEHKLSSEITFCTTIELLAARWKSLLWICLALIMNWLSNFAFEFLGLGWNSLPDCFTPTSKPCYESCPRPNHESVSSKVSWIQGYQAILETHPTG